MRHESGLTLIEVMIAAALLAAALVVLAQLVTNAVTSNIAAGQATTAVVAASEKLEELRASPARPAPGRDQVAVFVRRWTIDPLPGSALGTYVIQVDVEAPARPVISLVSAARWP